MNYILITALTVFVILIVFFIAVKINMRFRKSYEKKFQEAFNYEESNELDKAIKKYEEVIKNANDLNPMLINTYLLLSDAYHEKGPTYDDAALAAIDNAIKIVSNKKVNQEDVYLKSALFYKADFLKKIKKYQIAKDVLKDMQDRFSSDKLLLGKINRRMENLNVQN